MFMFSSRSSFCSSAGLPFSPVIDGVNLPDDPLALAKVSSFALFASDGLYAFSRLENSTAFRLCWVPTEMKGHCSPSNSTTSPRSNWCGDCLAFFCRLLNPLTAVQGFTPASG
jgi:hypothetical protein